MRQRLKRLKPTRGFAPWVYLLLSAIVPVAVFGLVRLELGWTAFVVVILAKWRMLAVKPRHWPANIRANLVDLTVSLSLVGFLVTTLNLTAQMIWASMFLVWLVVIKPFSSEWGVLAQAALAQVLGVSALVLLLPDQPLLLLVVGAWLVSFGAARHCLSLYNEPLVRAYAMMWAWFVSLITYSLGHWLIEINGVPQITLVVGAVAYGVVMRYRQSHQAGRPSKLRFQYVAVSAVIVLVLLLFSNWQYVPL